MFFKSFLLFIAVMSSVLEKSISVTESPKSDLEGKLAAEESSFVTVYNNGLFACIGYIYSLDSLRVFAFKSCISETEFINNKEYRKGIVVKSTSGESGVQDVLGTPTFIVIFLQNELGSQLQVGFNPTEVLNIGEKFEIEGCAMIRWDKVDDKFNMFYRTDGLVCVDVNEFINAQLPHKIIDVFWSGSIKGDYSAILLKYNNVIAFCTYVRSVDKDKNLQFGCYSYKKERGDLIKLERKKSMRGFAGNFLKFKS